jgi:hypothetical protein
MGLSERLTAESCKPRQTLGSQVSELLDRVNYIVMIVAIV